MLVRISTSARVDPGKREYMYCIQYKNATAVLDKQETKGYPGTNRLTKAGPSKISTTVL